MIDGTPTYTLKISNYDWPEIIKELLKISFRQVHQVMGPKSFWAAYEKKKVEDMVVRV
jgi:hypothetical protein